VRSRLNHPLASAPRHRELREYYKRWLALRARHAALGARGKSGTRVTLQRDGAVLSVSRRAPTGERIEMLANLTAGLQIVSEPPADWRLLLDSADPRFGGPGGEHALLGYQVLLYEATR
jgi:hypothetical protein